MGPGPLVAREGKGVGSSGTLEGQSDVHYTTDDLRVVWVFSYRPASLATIFFLTGTASPTTSKGIRSGNSFQSSLPHEIDVKLYEGIKNERKYFTTYFVINSRYAYLLCVDRRER